MTIFKQFIEGSFTPPKSLNRCKSDNNRIDSIDLAKGICILLVLMLHISEHLIPTPNFGALRMPLYFTLSGLFFKDYSPKVFIAKKVNNILVPFIFWLFISELIYFAWQLVVTREIVTPLIFQDPEIHTVNSNGPIWFLFALFNVNLIFYGISFLLKDFKKIFLAVIILSFAGFLCFSANINLPFWLDASLSALPFFFLGFFFRKIKFISSKRNFRILLAGIGFCLLSYLIYYTFGENCVGFRNNYFYGNPLLAYLNSCLFVAGILLLCQMIRWLPIISYLGRFSIIVLVLHWPIAMYLPSILSAFTHIVLSGEEVLLLTIFSCWVAIPICIRFIPKFVSQKPLFKIPQTKTSKAEITISA